MFSPRILFLLGFIIAAKAFTDITSEAHYCGEKLDKALEYVCRGNYNEKRGFPSMNLDMNRVDSEETPIFPGIYLSRPMVLRRIARRSAGVASLCCYRGCSLRQLSQFCGY